MKISELKSILDKCPEDMDVLVCYDSYVCRCDDVTIFYISEDNGENEKALYIGCSGKAETLSCMTTPLYEGRGFTPKKHLHFLHTYKN